MHGVLYLNIPMGLVPPIHITPHAYGSGLQQLMELLDRELLLIDEELLDLERSYWT